VADAGIVLPHGDARDHRHPHALAREAWRIGPSGAASVPRRDHERGDAADDAGREGDRHLSEGLVIAIAVALAVYALAVVALIVAGRGHLARELVALLPNLALLFRDLIRDPRVARSAKVALVIGAAWIASPIDLIPEFIPIAGPLDDALVAAIVLRYVLRRTDREVLFGHWRGERATLERILRVARA
jgi:uncharacterized membrane protein YkvA (DUF1232 family)